MILKRTKIITTIGPASDSKECMEQLLSNGMNTIRVNFSHGDEKEQGNRIELARKITSETGQPISVMLDTKGPEIRVCEMKNGAQNIARGTLVKIECLKKILGTNAAFSVTDSTGKYNMINDVHVGSRILVDDGKLVLEVKKINTKNSVIEALADNSHVLKTNKRINIPGAEYSIPFLSDKDIYDLLYGCLLRVDYVAASFVNSADNVREIRQLLETNASEHIQVISKIETAQACRNIEEIVAASDGVMVARGDLGLEIPFEDVPYWQKLIVKTCRNVGKPVIIATQMLDSMEHNPLPTRAEVTDVYFAGEIGADATMLSGESANGDFPVKACQTMAIINLKSEDIFNYSSAIHRATRNEETNNTRAAKKLAEHVYQAKPGRKIDFVIVTSDDCDFYEKISSFRPNTIVLGITTKKRLLTRFGVYNSLYMNLANDLEKVTTKELLEVAKTWGATRLNVVEHYNINKKSFDRITVQ